MKKQNRRPADGNKTTHPTTEKRPRNKQHTNQTTHTNTHHTQQQQKQNEKVFPVPIRRVRAPKGETYLTRISTSSPAKSISLTIRHSINRKRIPIVTSVIQTHQFHFPICNNCIVPTPSGGREGHSIAITPVTGMNVVQVSKATLLASTITDKLTFRKPRGPPRGIGIMSIRCSQS